MNQDLTYFLGLVQTLSHARKVMRLREVRGNSASCHAKYSRGWSKSPEALAPETRSGPVVVSLVACQPPRAPDAFCFLISLVLPCCVEEALRKWRPRPFSTSLFPLVRWCSSFRHVSRLPCVCVFPRQNRLLLLILAAARDMSLVADYSSDSDDAEPAPANPRTTINPAILALQAGGGSEDDDDDSEDEAEAAAKMKRQKIAAEEEAAAAASGLPSFEDALANADTNPEWMRAPGGEFEHVAFDDTAVTAAGLAAAASEAEAAAAAAQARAAKMQQRAAAGSGSSGGAAGSSSSSGSSGFAAKQPAAAAMRDRARGVAPTKEKEKESVKDRTKEKRKKDQSASFLGGRWKSDEEMHLRDHFDS